MRTSARENRLLTMAAGLSLLLAACRASDADEVETRDAPASSGAESVRSIRITPCPTGRDASLRGLAAVSRDVAWVTGSGGTVLRTIDGGKTWSQHAPPGTAELDFRDVEAFDESTVWLMSAGLGPASRIFVSANGGETWTTSYVQTHATGFLDGLAAWDERRGIAYGDPLEGAFQVLVTNDGGASWGEIPREALPPALEGEAGFAASGTGIRTASGGRAWFCTGGSGTVARVFRTSDYGASWSVASTPLPALTASAGGFSLAVSGEAPDDRLSLLVGGDYAERERGDEVAAASADDGRTWSLLPGAPRGQRAGSAYATRRASGVAPIGVAVGQTGCDLSIDGRFWWPLTDDGYHCVAFAPDGTGWLAGPNGDAARIDRPE